MLAISIDQFAEVLMSCVWCIQRKKTTTAKWT